MCSFFEHISPLFPDSFHFLTYSFSTSSIKIRGFASFLHRSILTLEKRREFDDKKEQTKIILSKKIPTNASIQIP